jgi:hypothetical protein
MEKENKRKNVKLSPKIEGDKARPEASAMQKIDSRGK